MAIVRTIGSLDFVVMYYYFSYKTEKQYLLKINNE